MVYVNSENRLLTLVGVISLLVAACSANEPAGVASISGTTSTQADRSTEDLDSLLAFAGCMRENGLEDFEDPIVDSDGKVEFPSKADESEETKGRFDEFDKESPEFEAAEEQCADLFGPSKDDK